MTRETRIGLLVGLLFIIMFGLVLSGLTNSNAPAPAVAPGNVAGNTAPGDVRDLVYVPTMDADRHPVPSAASVPATQPAPAADAADGRVTVAMHAEPVDGVTVNGNPPPDGRAVDAAPGGAAARSVRTGGGVEVVPLDGLGSALGAHAPDGAAPGPGAALPAGTTIYEVKQGDTLSRIARLEYGPTNASKHTLIFEANKDKLKNAAGLKVGMKLVIPPLPRATPAAAPAAPTTRPTTPDAPAPARTGLARHDEGDPTPTILAAGGTRPRAADAPARAGSSKIYTIKTGDTIYKIAKASGTTIDKILKANKVRNVHDLKVGTKLEIPKPVGV